MAKPRFMKHDTRAWERAANELARCYTQIYPCAECGGPVKEGYCCQRCGSTGPERRSAEAQ